MAYTETKIQNTNLTSDKSKYIYLTRIKTMSLLFFLVFQLDYDYEQTLFTYSFIYFLSIASLLSLFWQYPWDIYLYEKSLHNIDKLANW